MHSIRSSGRSGPATSRRANEADRKADSSSPRTHGRDAGTTGDRAETSPEPRDRAEPGAVVGMTVADPVAESRIEEYWDWITVALFLLLAVDLLTTLTAARLVGTGAESNPLMRWLLGRDILVVVGAHLVVVVAVTGFFRLLVRRLRRMSTPADRYFALLIEAWLGVLIAVGLGVFANNLAVIVLGGSLV